MENDDKLSTNICQICKDKLLQAYHFRQQCISVNNRVIQTQDENNCLQYELHITSKELDSQLINEDDKVQNDNSSYPCSKCTRTFQTKYAMHRHLKTHTENNNLICQICKRAFSRRTDVKRHMTLHTGEKPFKCVVCNASFTQSGTLAQHLRKHNNVKEKPVKKCRRLEERPHLCSLCGKSFKDSYSLTIHIRRHTGDKPYHCKVCNMR